mmetsp:Transcript_50683/g.76131  ORF Transcript_50683/g.76131 Transcript_50683/m.76131 type:complete len:151 (+) Transcript_50683:2-454(+)
MEALDRKASHVPYHASKLTHMLKGCLGGNSRTMMVVTVSPEIKHVQEALCALHFGKRAKHIKLDSLQSNISPNNNEERMETPEEEIKSQEKVKGKSGEIRRVLRIEQRRVQDKLALYKKSKLIDIGSSESVEDLRRNLNEMFMESDKKKE